MKPQEKAKQIARNIAYNLGNKVCDDIKTYGYEDVYNAALQALQWEDEQHTKEKQQWIEEAAEWLKHNIYDYFYWIEMEGESEANIKDTLFDDFKKSNGGKDHADKD